ncbi:PREDICTED: uncharacterized protein LOC107082229 [Cyprinodon variegatus]|uniref:Si:dkeyp-77h1.4 n=1 Tax=Cyprinodon variegatus TaxID=28743 RepID=A0A3Q2EKG2_CYPVA|nr:PREDICTED: uncharacterized protein LOC107082229 [Cyprinodon variegatus]
MQKSATMMKVSGILISFLISAAIPFPLQGEESITLFHGEDFQIVLPPYEVELTFRNYSDPRNPSDPVLMRGGKVISSRAKHSLQLSHLIIEAVGEGDEGLYILKDSKNPKHKKEIKLIVRDCTIEQIVKYGDNFKIPIAGVNTPISLEYRPSAVEANQTSRPAVVVLTAAGTSIDPYRGRISVSERYITISAATVADEGSFTVRDSKGFIQKKVCLNVKEHNKFETRSTGERLKINLILNSSLVQLYYSQDPKVPENILLMDKGEFIIGSGFEDRLSLEGSVVFLDQIKASDAGLFRVTDLQGFNISTVQLGLKPYTLDSLYVAIIALLGLLAFLLLVCLLSCLIKIKKRAKRAAALEKLAQNAGKEDEGEAFRQVVKNITKLSEESKHSQADNTEKSQSTEVDIKGLEVSSKEVGVGNLETSDSGVGFNTALPLDTDTDVPDQIPDSEAVSISAAPEIKPSPPSAAETKPAAPPVPETKASPVPEPKTAPTQPVEGKLDAPKPLDTKLSPTPSPEPGLSPADKIPAPSPSPEPKTGLSPADPKPAPSPSLEPKTGLSPSDPKPAPSRSPEPKTGLKSADLKPALSPSPEPKTGLSPADPKPAPSPSPELKTGLSPADTKPAPSPSPEPKTGLSPADPKPSSSPSPEPKTAAPITTSPTPEVKSASASPEPPKPTPAEPITNGTPGPDSKASPDHADIIKDPTPKEVSTKTLEVEMKSSSVEPEASKDGTAHSTTT